MSRHVVLNLLVALVILGGFGAYLYVEQTSGAWQLDADRGRDTARGRVVVPATPRPVSPLVYGMAAVSAEQVQAQRVPVNRWGGNTACRYNWRIDAWNTGKDWYFRNVRAEIGWKEFLAGCEKHGAVAILTVPMAGYVAKDDKSCSYSVAKYGPQRAKDPAVPDAGDGFLPDGKPILSNDPLDANEPVTEEFLAAWFNAIAAAFPALLREDRLIIALGNEPMLWNLTHQDIHPEPAGYDEVLRKHVTTALLVRKHLGRGVRIAGPELWGWPAYFSSARDRDARNDHDRAAHGDMDFLPWFLKNVRAKETELGVRLLDILTVHFYPQGEGIFSDRADVATTRLESVRSLYDPLYKDPSWIKDRVRLLPRMREWIDAWAPGVQFGLTEYNWGAEGDISGALALADVLGVLGRERADLACLWQKVKPGSPSAKAYDLMRGLDEGLAGVETRSLEVAWPEDGGARSLSAYAYHHPGRNRAALLLLNKRESPRDVVLDIRSLKPSKPRARALARGREGLPAPERMLLSDLDNLQISLYPMSLTRVDLESGL